MPESDVFTNKPFVAPTDQADNAAGNPGTDQGPLEHVVFFADGGFIRVWADNAQVERNGDLVFYKERASSRTVSAVTGEKKTFFGTRTEFGNVEIKTTERIPVAVFRQEVWIYYMLSDEASEYGGIVVGEDADGIAD